MVQWPPHSRIVVYNTEGKEVVRSQRSRLDLSDSLMSGVPGETRDVYIEVEVSKPGRDSLWTTWNTGNVARIERHIDYDLTFDGYDVRIRRETKPGKLLCSKPFRWQLQIHLEDDLEEARTQIAKRYKAARSDGSVKSIQTTIEKVFGVPKGSVALLTPEGRQARATMKIKGLRNKWKNAGY